MGSLFTDIAHFMDRNEVIRPDKLRKTLQDIRPACLRRLKLLYVEESDMVDVHEQMVA
jgi:hypothetical protein